MINSSWCSGTHHFPPAACHDCWTPPLGAHPGFGAGGFGCDAEVERPRLAGIRKDEMQFLMDYRNGSEKAAAPHPARSHWGPPGRLTPWRRPSRSAPGRCGGAVIACGGLLQCRRRCLCQPALPPPPVESRGYCPGPSVLQTPQRNTMTGSSAHYLWFQHQLLVVQRSRTSFRSSLIVGGTT